MYTNNNVHNLGKRNLLKFENMVRILLSGITHLFEAGGDLVKSGRFNYTSTIFIAQTNFKLMLALSIEN